MAADPDTSAIEVGLKFSSDVDGLITGVRLYKGTKNTGPMWAAFGAPPGSYWHR